MRKATLIYLLNNQDQICLCMKKRWFGQWKYNWPWGKLKDWETSEQCILRELQEETWVKLDTDSIVHRWNIKFYFENKDDRNQEVSIFISHYNGDLKETEEMKPYRIDISQIPYDDMREPDRHWLPRILQSDDMIQYDIFFDIDAKLKNMKKIK